MIFKINRLKFQNMLYKKITTFFQEENIAARKEKKKIEKSNSLLSQETITNKCQNKLHQRFTQKLLQVIMMSEEINNAKTLKLISLLP